jgi:phosphoenolpyruvate carboxylase
MLRFISQQQNPLWFKPFLGSSIRLRSPMIHPLNLLQIIACREKDFALLRLTVTGISSGMLTTG